MADILQRRKAATDAAGPQRRGSNRDMSDCCREVARRIMSGVQIAWNPMQFQLDIVLEAVKGHLST